MLPPDRRTPSPWFIDEVAKARRAADADILFHVCRPRPLRRSPSCTRYLEGQLRTSTCAGADRPGWTRPLLTTRQELRPRTPRPHHRLALEGHPQGHRRPARLIAARVTTVLMAGSRSRPSATGHPCLLMRDGERLFLMQRTKAGGDARLHDLYSLGIEATSIPRTAASSRTPSRIPTRRWSPGLRAAPAGFARRRRAGGPGPRWRGVRGRRRRTTWTCVARLADRSCSLKYEPVYRR